MIFYSAIFLFIVFFVLLAKQVKSLSGLMYFIIFSILFILAAFRGDVGQDTLSYGVIYNGMVDLEALGNMLLRQEPLLNILIYVHKFFFDSYTGFLVLVAFLHMAILSYAVRNMYHKGMFLIFYVLMFYLELQFNVIRVAFAILFFMAALSDVHENPKKAILWSCLAVLSHITILIVFPVLFYRAALGTKRLILSILAGSFISIAVFYLFHDLIVSKAAGYGILDVSETKFSTVTLGLSIIMLLTMYLTKNKSKELVASLLVMIFTFAFYSITEIAYRMMDVAIIVFTFLLFESQAFWRNARGLSVKPVLYGGLILCSWFAMSKVYYVAKEPHNRYVTGSGNYHFSFIPYTFFYESEYRFESVK